MPERKIVALAAVLFLAAIAASAQTPDQPPPRAGDTVAWYTVRQGDTLIGITIHYLGSPSLWTENLRINPQIHDPKHLKPGSRIRVIVSRQLPKRNALVDRVARRVDAKPDPQPWATAHEGDLLKENDGVRTYEKSSADLKFDDGSHLTMTENSLLFLKEMRPAQRGPVSETIEIIDGQIDLTSRPKKKETAELHVLIGGTLISHNATGDRPVATRSRKASDAKAQVMVYGGSSLVASAGKSVDVRAGMGTQVEQGKAPEPPQKLLPAPALVEPAAEATLRSGFGWKSVPDAVSYTIEIYRDADATQLVERATGVVETLWRTTALPYGDFYWRATAVSKAGLDGFPAKLVRFRSAAELQGNVAEDVKAAGSIEGAPPLAAVRVIAWRDDGNGVPDDADVRAGETRTDARGRFSFDGLAPAVYWIAVDSLTIAPTGAPAGGLNARLNTGAAAESIWAEQTFGSIGTFCSDGSGAPVTRTAAGPCVGGRWASQSDDPRKLSTSKHLARVDTTDPAVRATASFGFSFNVVDNTDDKAGDEGEGSAGRSRQGSLRQFIRNANAIAGPNAMRFLPATAEQQPWWTIHCATPLPRLTDGGTSIDGTAWMAGDPTRPRTAAAKEQHPDLEVEVAGKGEALTTGGETTIASIALQSAGTAVRAGAALSARNLLIGLHPDGTPGLAGETGITSDGGDLRLETVTIAGRSTISLSVGAGSRLIASRVSVRSAAPDGVAAVVIDGNGSTIDQSEIDGGGHATGLAIESGGANVQIRNTAILHAADGIVIRGGASGNSLLSDRFEDISGTAILFDPKGGARPSRNRISEAEFVSVGTPIGSTGGASSARAGACAYDDSAVNRGIAVPVIGGFEIVPGGFRSLYGRACTGTRVEIYAGGITGGRTTARFVRSLTPDYDGTFHALVEHMTNSTRTLVNATDKDGNTSLFSTSQSTETSKTK